ncbi:hypothetical protein [Pedosphaera parvula]|uniref:hypothetical protein n=1 Tax=Pedosphaera parvula TaxID=1032527 RepID=UPI0012376537|nr:hypothetical protein [Pedosphaera parvula]
MKEIHEGSQAASLTAPQSRDALAALERLQTYYQSTGRRISLLGAVSEYVEAASKLNGQPSDFGRLDEAAPPGHEQDGQRPAKEARFQILSHGL